MNLRFKNYYRDIAWRTADLSRARRLKVGAIIVKDDRIISIGFNGTPSGWDNNCEKRVSASASGGKIDFDYIVKHYPYIDENDTRYKLVTLDEVLHAESNAISKLAKSSESGDKAVMFCTHAPCIHCSKMIYQTGIETVYYSTAYRDTSGIEFLTKAGVNVVHLK